MRTKHTALLDWLKTAGDEAVKRTGTTRAYLRQIGYGNKTATPIVATSVERETDQKITRKDLRPDDWNLIWPELLAERTPDPPAKKAAA